MFEKAMKTLDSSSEVAKNHIKIPSLSQCNALHYNEYGRN